jgi:predicted dehydrogenase
MGQHHARVYSDLEGVQLVGIADCNLEAAQRVAKRHGGRAYREYKRMLEEEQIDLATIAVPTELHHRVALDVIQCGIHVLIEKPLAMHVEQGAEIIRQAQRQGVVLMVGHIERFNPAVLELKQQLASGTIGRIFHLNARRWSPFPQRIRDTGVVLDLATHDIDVIRYLVGDSVDRLYAETDHLLSSSEDSVKALLRFRSGVLGMLDINWLTPCKVRQLSVTGERGMITVDYLSQELFVYKNSAIDSGWDRLTFFTGVAEGDMIRPAFVKREPLVVELESFVQAVAEGHPPEITGEDALTVLKLAAAILDSAQTKQPICIS